MKPSYFWRITTFSPLIRFITMLVSWCWSISIVLFQIKMREEQKYKKNITLALYISSCILYHWNHIGSVMVSVLTLSAVDHRFESWLGQTKDYKIGICCFSAKHAAWRRKSKDCLGWNQDNMSVWGNMSISGLVSVS